MARLPLAVAAYVLWQSAPAVAGWKDVRDWSAVCDNVRTCAALAITDKPTGSYLRIDRDAAPNAAPRIAIVVSADKGSAFDMAFDDRSIPGLPRSPIKATEETTRVEIKEPVAVEAMLAALRKAQKLTITYTDAANKKPDERTVAEISLSGAAGAMLWIDEQQKRLGTVAALVQRGEKPASSVPAPPALPMIKRAKPGKTPIPKAFPAPLAAKVKTACGEEEDRPKAGEINRLSGNLLLYWVECPSSSGAYNHHFVPIVAPADRPQTLRMVKLPPVPGEKQDTDVDIVTNGHLDPETLVLSQFNKGRGLGDCGDYTEWAWDGQAFRVLLHKVMPVCGAMSLDEWPVLYRAALK